MARPFGPFVPSGKATGCQCSAPSVELYSAPSPALPMLPSSDRRAITHVKSSIRSARQAPRERLLLRDAVILQRPGASAIRTLVDSSAKAGDVEDSCIHRAGRIEQDMSRTGLIHSGIRLGPVLAAILADGILRPCSQDRSVSPHLRTRKIMGIAVHAPHPAANFGIEDDPVRRVLPFAGNSVPWNSSMRRRHPRCGRVRCRCT